MWRRPRVRVVDLVFCLVAGHSNFLSVYHHDIVTRINMRGVFWLVFAAQTYRKLRSKPTQSLTRGVHQVPIPLNFFGFCGKRFHSMALDSIHIGDATAEK